MQRAVFERSLGMMTSPFLLSPSDEPLEISNASGGALPSPVEGVVVTSRTVSDLMHPVLTLLTYSQLEVLSQRLDHMEFVHLCASCVINRKIVSDLCFFFCWVFRDHRKSLLALAAAESSLLSGLVVHSFLVAWMSFSSSHCFKSIGLQYKLPPLRRRPLRRQYHPYVDFQVSPPLPLWLPALPKKRICCGAFLWTPPRKVLLRPSLVVALSVAKFSLFLTIVVVSFSWPSVADKNWKQRKRRLSTLCVEASFNTCTYCQALRWNMSLLAASACWHPIPYP